MKKNNIKYVALINPQGHIRKKNIPIAKHPDTGGQIVYIIELARELGELGVKVDIFTRWFDDEEWPGYTKKIEKYSKNVRIVRIKCGTKKFYNKEKLWWVINSYCNGIIDFFKKENCFPDILTSHYGDGGIAAAILKKRLKIPFTHTGHSLGGNKMDNLKITKDNYNKYNSKYNFHLRVAAERISFNHAAGIIVSTKEEITKQYGHRVYNDAISIKDNKFRIIPPGINPEQFYANTNKSVKLTPAEKFFEKQLKRDIASKRLNLPFILSASRFAAKKNAVGLVLSYAKNKKLQEKSNLVVIAGKIDEPLSEKSFEKLKPVEQDIVKQIKTILDEYNLKGKVCFSKGFDFKTGMPYVYRYAARKKAVFINPALHEPFGLTIVEAMASGLPVVSTDNGGPVDILSKGKFGKLVDVTNHKQVAKALLELVSSKSEWNKFAKLAVKRVTDEYTWKVNAAAYLKFFNTIIEENQSTEVSLQIPAFFTTLRKRDNSKVDKLLKKLYFK